MSWLGAPKRRPLDTHNRKQAAPNPQHKLKPKARIQLNPRSNPIQPSLKTTSQQCARLLLFCVVWLVGMALGRCCGRWIGPSVLLLAFVCRVPVAGNTFFCAKQRIFHAADKIVHRKTCANFFFAFLSGCLYFLYTLKYLEVCLGVY